MSFDKGLSPTFLLILRMLVAVDMREEYLSGQQQTAFIFLTITNNPRWTSSKARPFL